MGYWSFLAKKYKNRRLIRTVIRRQIIIFNYQHGLNNSEAIIRYNRGFYSVVNGSFSKDDGMYCGR